MHRHLATELISAVLSVSPKHTAEWTNNPPGGQTAPTIGDGGMVQYKDAVLPI